MNNEGWISLYRKFLDWEWYSDLPVRVLFLHCLLKANHKAKKWMGQIIQPGQFATSLKHLSEETALSQQQCRTALFKLKSTGEITSQSTSQYSIITVNNWKQYQTKQQTFQQTSNKRATTNNNENNNSINTSINISSSSSSSIEEFEKFYKNLEEEEEETLKIFSKKEKIKCFRPWLRKIYNNGDYEEVKKQAYEYKYRLEEAQKIKEAQKQELEQQKQQERELTPEERKIFLQKAREKAGINKLRRAKK